MSSAQATDTRHTGQHVSEREEGEQAGRKLTLVLFGGLVAFATIGITLSAIAGSMIHHRPPAEAGGLLASSSAPAPLRLSLYVAPAWKPGPGGERHDAFSKTNFNVKVGQSVQLTIDNRDDAVHGIDAAAAGVNVVAMPGKHTYTFTVSKAGTFKWICPYPCDPFSMGHTGYMQGYITAT